MYKSIAFPPLPRLVENGVARVTNPAFTSPSASVFVLVYEYSKSVCTSNAHKLRGLGIPYRPSASASRKPAPDSLQRALSASVFVLLYQESK